MKFWLLWADSAKNMCLSICKKRHKVLRWFQCLTFQIISTAQTWKLIKMVILRKKISWKRTAWLLFFEYYLVETKKNYRNIHRYIFFTLKFHCLWYEKTYTIRRYQGGIRKKIPAQWFDCLGSRVMGSIFCSRLKGVVDVSF